MVYVCLDFPKNYKEKKRWKKNGMNRFPSFSTN